MVMPRQHGGWAIMISVFVALVLTTLPVPEWAVLWRPSWVALVVIYWCMAVPARFGIVLGWILGLTLDVHAGTLLGQHALSMSVMAFISLVIHQRVRVLPLWQQGVSVFGLVFIYNTMTLWVNGVQGKPVEAVAYWSVPFMSMVLWPWIYIILRDVRRRFRVY
jgi:rod shape-determining protein MreD